MANDFVYRCSRACPINKRCFVIKVENKITQPLHVMYKCKAKKKEILLRIEDNSDDFIIEKEKEEYDG